MEKTPAEEKKAQEGPDASQQNITDY